MWEPKTAGPRRALDGLGRLSKCLSCPVHLSLPAHAFSPFFRLTCFDPLIRTTQPTCCYSISHPKRWWFSQIPEKGLWLAQLGQTLPRSIGCGQRRWSHRADGTVRTPCCSLQSEAWVRGARQQLSRCAPQLALGLSHPQTRWFPLDSWVSGEGGEGSIHTRKDFKICAAVSLPSVLSPLMVRRARVVFKLPWETETGSWSLG